MCEPTTAAIIFTAVSGGLQAYGQIEAGNAAHEAAQYQAQVERNSDPMVAGQVSGGARQAKPQLEPPGRDTVFTKPGQEKRGDTGARRRRASP